MVNQIVLNGVFYLQISWFIDYIPSWLSSLLMVSGFFLSTIGHLHQYPRRRFKDINLVGMILMGMGISLVAFFAFISAPVLMIILLIATRWLEGVAAIRLYQKAAFVLESGQLPSSINLRTRIPFKISVIF
jgi:hypothetical protein